MDNNKKKKVRNLVSLYQMSQAILMSFSLFVLKSSHRPSRKEAAKKISQDSIWIREIHWGCAKEEDQKGAGWLPTCRELERICDVVACLLSPKKDSPHLGLLPELSFHLSWWVAVATSQTAVLWWCFRHPHRKQVWEMGSHSFWNFCYKHNKFMFSWVLLGTIKEFPFLKVWFWV